MSPEERKDLNELLEKLQNLKNNFWSMAKTLDRATETDLMHMGCKGMTQGAAMQLFFKKYVKDELALQKAHTKKWPD